MSVRRKKKLAIVAQFGGPTSVINRTLFGATVELQKRDIEVWGPSRGIDGVLNNDFLIMSEFSDLKIDQVRRKPGSYLGTSKFNVNENSAPIIAQKLKDYGATFFFMIGGDSTATIANKILRASSDINHQIDVVHIPKTIDNDLVETDHCPGYGSSALTVAKVAFGLDQENRSQGGIHLQIIMGRDAGFLAAASTLLRGDGGPHLVYLPERSFNLGFFIRDVEDVLSRTSNPSRAFIVASEGIRQYYDDNGERKSRLIADIAADEMKEAVENEENLGGISLSVGSSVMARYLSNKLQSAFPSERVRADVLGYVARSYPDVSNVDAVEAEFVGKEAVRYALEGRGSGSVIIKRTGHLHTYSIETEFIDLERVAGKTRNMPKNFIGTYAKDVSEDFLNYAGPLIGHVPGFDYDHLLPQSWKPRINGSLL
ncbi:MAG: diphosphate--fructose-6-phosphate 1-phosphotransferase [Candidatus Kapabacteria bacterium]|nr:diphosphate--fructose-6-phosphate 1-phosphotransferase [Ignavibacteriota bacterium]MCW5884259.1 diphosphate--fructose-6-phosphate 1-phosphotransferase [Candidatus Kapabacteria bacterium]